MGIKQIFFPERVSDLEIYIYELEILMDTHAVTGAVIEQHHACAWPAFPPCLHTCNYEFP